MAQLVTGATHQGRPMTRAALAAFLRNTVPEPTDQLGRLTYEQALQEWCDLSEAERAMIGFGKYLDSQVVSSI